MTILRNEKGQGLTEYLILLILVAVASIAMVKSLGSAVKGRLKVATTAIKNVKVEDRNSGGSNTFGNFLGDLLGGEE